MRDEVGHDVLSQIRGGGCDGIPRSAPRSPRALRLRPRLRSRLRLRPTRPRSCDVEALRPVGIVEIRERLRQLDRQFGSCAVVRSLRRPPRALPRDRGRRGPGRVRRIRRAWRRLFFSLPRRFPRCRRCRCLRRCPRCRRSRWPRRGRWPRRVRRTRQTRRGLLLWLRLLRPLLPRAAPTRRLCEDSLQLRVYLIRALGGDDLDARRARLLRH